MGGNALKNTVTRRYSADEYEILEDEVVDILNRFLHSTCRPIRAYYSKESFGDMDIVICSDNLPTDYLGVIKAVFRPNEMVVNGNCVSFDYRQLQIDLILTPREHYFTSLAYFDFNDLGNLLGRVSHAMGLKLGHDGLSYNWRVETHQFRNIILLTEWRDILPVLGYDYTTWENGFDTIEDIFKFVVTSPFFNKDVYLLKNRNATSRVRDAKRKTYMEFLKWLEGYEDNLIQQYYKKREKDKWLHLLFMRIPGFINVYNKVQAEWDAEMEYRRRFNGGLVTQWTGLQGVELGKFMRYIKEDYGIMAFKDIVTKVNDDRVEGFVHYMKTKWELDSGIKGTVQQVPEEWARSCW